mmetsp:Transcript_1899/g.5440  ORF Transcript_1899/g.5440 Transcript_1899/m.5440 type:complete len:281 (+) Transcript_1899:771-1613(+)
MHVHDHQAVHAGRLRGEGAQTGRPRLALEEALANDVEHFEVAELRADQEVAIALREEPHVSVVAVDKLADGSATEDAAGLLERLHEVQHWQARVRGQLEVKRLVKLLHEAGDDVANAHEAEDLRDLVRLVPDGMHAGDRGGARRGGPGGGLVGREGRRGGGRGLAEGSSGWRRRAASPLRLRRGAERHRERLGRRAHRHGSRTAAGARRAAHLGRIAPERLERRDAAAPFCRASRLFAAHGRVGPRRHHGHRQQAALRHEPQRRLHRGAVAAQHRKAPRP